MATKRKTSLIWNHFSQNDTKKTAKCNYCSMAIAITGGNTGNLARHMKRKHPTISINPLVRKLTSENTAAALAHDPQLEPGDSGEMPSIPTKCNCTQMTDFLQNTTPLPPSRAAQLDHQLVKMISKEYHIFRLVEGEEFKKFIHMLNPRYSLPTSKTLSQVLVPQLYFKMLHEVEQKINAAHSICLTTDSWTSINNVSVIALTAHYICEKVLCTNLLCCIEYEQRHTSDNLADFLRSKILKWKIQNKVSAIVSDNAANITAAIRIGNWPHIGCFTHSLNLVVLAGISKVQTTLTKVKHIVRYFKLSSHATTKLHEVQNQRGLPILKLKQDVATRWNSTYDMLSRLLACQEAVIATLALINHDLTLTPEEWRIVQEVIPILKIFYEISTEMSTEKQVSLSKVIVYCRLLRQHLYKCDTSTLSIQTQNFIETLKEQVHKRFYEKTDVEAHMLYAEACILDPRFKQRGFVDINKYERALAALKKKVGVSYVRNIASVIVQPSTSTTTPAPSLSSSFWQDFDQEEAALIPSNPVAAGILEIDKYIQEPLINRNEDPLVWWHERKHVYPILYNYILKRLNLVATSVPCERTFSKAGLIMTETRSRLSSEKLAQLLFIANNMK